MHLLAVLWPGLLCGEARVWGNCLAELWLGLCVGWTELGCSQDPVMCQLLCGDGEAQGTCLSHCGPPLYGKVGLRTFIYLSSVPGALINSWYVPAIEGVLKPVTIPGGKSHLTSSFRLIRCHTFRQHLLKYADIDSCVQLICACALPQVLEAECCNY